jgi:hypothetical protein
LNLRPGGASKGWMWGKSRDGVSPTPTALPEGDLDGFDSEVLQERASEARECWARRQELAFEALSFAARPH